MKIHFRLLIICLLPLYTLSQNLTDFGRVYTDTLPESFDVSVSEIREHVYAGIPDSLIPKDYPALAYQFAGKSARICVDYLKSGLIYSDWPAFESYINLVLQKVMPKELENTDKVYAYLLKDGERNAYMTPAGIIFLNVGLFGEMKSEASLAGILCHELAHYHLRHSVKGYSKYTDGDFKPGFMMWNKNSYNNFSIASEIEADSLEIVWMHNAGYNLKGSLNEFQASERKEQNILLRNQDAWKLKEVTHPSSTRRQNKILDFMNANPDYVGNNYLVNELAFKQLKAKAKSEILKHLLNNFKYNLCIETAFKYHIFDVNNATYVHYLMEAIRRKCYLDNTDWSKNFITARYFKVIGEGKKKRKVKYNDHLFTRLPLEMLMLSPEMAEKIEAKFYWEDEVKFKTYEDAFHFFAKVGDLLDNPECILSNALSYCHNEKIMHQLLNEYLKHDNIRYRNYAEELLKGNIKTHLPKKKLTVLSNLTVISRNGKTETVLEDNNLNASNYYNHFLQKATLNIENCELLYLPDLQSTRLNDYTRLKELEKLSKKTPFANGLGMELHIFDPRYWQLMKDLAINEVEFINCYMLDIEKKLDQSLDFYKKIMNYSYDQLLSETGKTRFLYITINGVRSIEGGVMNVSYRQDEEKLKFKQPTEIQIIKQLNEHLKLKHLKAMNLDARKTN